ncbi:MAG TPA: hypothetical protein VJS20_11605 [Gemmatimonadales bacterium]|nr:hypothetical protein [Gemmatimonadales bacterium]
MWGRNYWALSFWGAYWGPGGAVVTPVAMTMAAQSQTSQTGTVGQSPTQLPSVLVTDQFGSPYSGATVTFAVTTGGGAGSGLVQVTGVSGMATVGGWTLGGTQGVNTMTATSGSLAGSPQTFTVSTFVAGPVPTGGYFLQASQTDSPSVFTGAAYTTRPANSQTLDRLCLGTPGLVESAVTLDALVKDVYAVSFDIPVPNETLWHGGTYVVRLNVRRANPIVTWNRVRIVRINAAGVFQAHIGSNERMEHVLGTSGVKEARVRGEAQYARTPGDRIIVICDFSNQGTLPPWNLAVSTIPQPFSLVFDQLIDTPLWL